MLHSVYKVTAEDMVWLSYNYQTQLTHKQRELHKADHFPLALVSVSTSASAESVRLTEETTILITILTGPDFLLVVTVKSGQNNRSWKKIKKIKTLKHQAATYTFSQDPFCNKFILICHYALYISVQNILFFQCFFIIFFFLPNIFFAKPTHYPFSSDYSLVQYPHNFFSYFLYGLFKDFMGLLGSYL